MSNATAWAPIVKSTKNPDGTLHVYGKVSDDTLDRDLQVCDKTWLATAVPKWFGDGGNIREQHSNIAAGVAVEHEVKADGHYVKALVVDPGTVAKVEHGVLKGFSIGIKRPRLTLDKTAPGGRIVDGDICEISLVDRPCNPGTLLQVVKSDSGSLVLDAPVELTQTAADQITAAVNQLALQVQAITDHALEAPVTNPAPAPAADPAPADDETGKTDTPDSTSTGTGTGTAGTDAFLTKTQAAELTSGLVTKTDLTAALSDALTKALEPVLDRLAKVEASPVPGGPVITRTASQAAQAAQHDTQLVKTQIAELLSKADSADSSLLAQGYRDRAAQLATTIA